MAPVRCQRLHHPVQALVCLVEAMHNGFERLGTRLHACDKVSFRRTGVQLEPYALLCCAQAQHIPGFRFCLGEHQKLGADQSAQTPPASDNTAPNELALAAAPESGPPPANEPASLLLRLACSHEHPDDPQFIAALAAFQSRTCYANADGDHLVGWANSSLRFKSELPALDAHRPSVREKGVALADAADAGFASAQSGGAGSPKASSALGPEQARADAEGCNTAAHDTAATSGSALAGEGHHSGAASALQPRTAVASTSGGRFSASTDGAAATARLTTAADVRACSRAEKVSAMMENLRSMPWARVDCTWRGAKVSTFAHNHIQVTRRWLNLEVRTRGHFAGKCTSAAWLCDVALCCGTLLVNRQPARAALVVACSSLCSGDRVTCACRARECASTWRNASPRWSGKWLRATQRTTSPS